MKTFVQSNRMAEYFTARNYPHLVDDEALKHVKQVSRLSARCPVPPSDNNRPIISCEMDSAKTSQSHSARHLFLERTTGDIFSFLCVLNMYFGTNLHVNPKLERGKHAPCVGLSAL